MDDEAKERRARARALLGYSIKGQEEFSEAASMHHDRLREVVRKGGRAAPSTDELLAMCDAAGVPRQFAVDGWSALGGAITPAIENRLERIVHELRAEQIRRANLQRALEGLLGEDLTRALAAGRSQ